MLQERFNRPQDDGRWSKAINLTREEARDLAVFLVQHLADTTPAA
jgi:hypothetical protein